MAEMQFHSNKRPRLLGISVERPVLVMLGLYIVAWVIKIFDLDFPTFRHFGLNYMQSVS
jgi:hypothetical protein